MINKKIILLFLICVLFSFTMNFANEKNLNAKNLSEEEIQELENFIEDSIEDSWDDYFCYDYSGDDYDKVIRRRNASFPLSVIYSIRNRCLDVSDLVSGMWQTYKKELFGDKELSFTEKIKLSFIVTKELCELTKKMVIDPAVGSTVEHWKKHNKKYLVAALVLALIKYRKNISEGFHLDIGFHLNVK